jgi:hypothetical protein
MKYKKQLYLISLVGVIVTIGAGLGFQKRSAITSLHQNNWSIGICHGTSFGDLTNPSNFIRPVITADSVTDIRADFVADPFLIHVQSVWYLFFEVFNLQTRQGDIAFAKSNDGFTWKYQQVALDEPYHLSYPFVFEWNNTIYMIPESAAGKKLKLYKAAPFPSHWEEVAVLLDGEFGDHGLFRYKNIWWLYAGADPYQHKSLRLFYADTLQGPWHEHPASPIITNNPGNARPGGRPLIFGDTIIRFAQECKHAYGHELNAFYITKLSKTEYHEVSAPINPVLHPGKEPWRLHGMHHMDAHRCNDSSWIASVDGYSRILILKYRY